MPPDKVALVAPEGLQSISEVLDCGLSFLQTASESSLLAARYLAMLNYVRATAAAPIPDNHRASEASVHEQEQSNSAGLLPSSESGMPPLGPFTDSDLWLDPVAWRFLTASEINLDNFELDRSLY